MPSAVIQEPWDDLVTRRVMAHEEEDARSTTASLASEATLPFAYCEQGSQE